MTSTSKRILIVDDEEDLTWSISRSLRKEDEQYEIICVNSGDEAVKFLNRISFDLLLSDIRMPGQNGLMLLGYAKKHFPDMKVIIMSAYYGPEIEALLGNRSDMFYVEKPFEIQYLKKVINWAFNDMNWHDFEQDSVFAEKQIGETINLDWKLLLEKCNSEM